MKTRPSKKGFKEELENACEGLVYISETDAAVEPFFDEEFSEENFEEIGFHEFFKKLTRNREWFGREEKRRAARFAKLRDVLEENLTDLKVYRSGRIKIDIFVVGKDESGRFAGVRTRAVET